MTVDGMELASQLFDFEIINGLETKVAQEVMIYDWTTLTRDARAYIDQFVADEMLRDAEFDNSQFDHNVAFEAAQTQRVTTFGESEAGRTITFNAAEEARATGYDADHSRADTDHTNAGTDRTNAATDRTNAATDRTNAAADRTLAGTDHTRADGDHTQALANNATVAGFNARVVAEETATAANKISAVKAKTFADVDARLEDLETDGAFMATNDITNGDFTNGTTGWTSAFGSISAANNILTATASGSGLENLAIVDSQQNVILGNKYYFRFSARVLNSVCLKIESYITGSTAGTDIRMVQLPVPVINQKYPLSFVSVPPSNGTGKLRFYIKHVYSDAATASGKTMEIERPLTLNLTTIFGAGKEPTATEMDRILARFTNSWFDGTKNLFAAKTAIEKQMQLDSGAIMEGSNLLVNGDLSNGTTGWQPNSATIAVANGILSVTGSGSFTHATVFQDSVKPVYVGQKIYTRAKVKVTNSAATSFKILLQGSVVGGTAMDLFSKSSPMLNEQFTASGIATITDQTGVVRIVFRGQYVDAATAVGKTYELSYINTIDLTATFGLGNEPTVEQMDAIMAKFENSWFDGTKNLFQAKASLNKLMALDARTEFEMKNGVVNGDFSNGTTGWEVSTITGAVAAVANNEITLTALATQTTEIKLVYKIPTSINNKLYLAATMLSNSNADAVWLLDTTTPNSITRLSHSGSGAYERLSKIITATNITMEFRLLDTSRSGDISSSPVKLKYATVIDLTAAFGAGKEPTLAEMDRLMARFSNSWFDGVKPIQTIETLYNEKANKTQESWITPTLINGWVEQSGYPVRYMKDEMGFVHVKGRIGGGAIGSYAFTMVSGYRPLELRQFPIPTSSPSVTTRGYVATGSVCPAESAYTTYVDISGITFRAEV